MCTTIATIPDKTDLTLKDDMILFYLNPLNPLSMKCFADEITLIARKESILYFAFLFVFLSGFVSELQYFSFDSKYMQILRLQIFCEKDY